MADELKSRRHEWYERDRVSQYNLGEAFCRPPFSSRWTRALVAASSGSATLVVPRSFLEPIRWLCIHSLRSAFAAILVCSTSEAPQLVRQGRPRPSQYVNMFHFDPLSDDIHTSLGWIASPAFGCTSWVWPWRDVRFRSASSTLIVPDLRIHVCFAGQQCTSSPSLFCG